MKKKLLALSLAAAVAALSLPAYAGVKDTVVGVLRGEPSNIDPHGNTELVAMTTQTQIFETLVKKDHEGKIVPSLATSWEQVNDRTMRFHLREGVKFHNGDTMTADDVVFTIQRATEKPSSASIFAAFDAKNTKAVDPLTVDVATKNPYAAMFNYLASTRGGVVSKRAVTEMGDAAFGRHPVGTGPFKFDNWVSGTSVTLKRFDNYWGQKPAYSTLVLKFITETANRALEIESGNADVVLDPDPTDLDRLADIDGIKVISGPSYAMSYIVFSMDNKNPALKDQRVRHALSLALDTTAITKAVFGNYATPAESVIPPTMFAFKSVSKHEYAPEKAKALLAEAGYDKGLTLKLSLPNSSEHQNTGVIAQNMWKQVGVTANITTASVSEVIAAGRRGDNEAAIMAGSYNTADPAHALADFDTRSDGWIRPNDKKIDEMLDKGAAIYDTEERAKVYAELQNYIYNTYFMIGVANKTMNYLITDKVQNFFADPGDFPPFAELSVLE